MQASLTLSSRRCQMKVGYYFKFQNTFNFVWLSLDDYESCRSAVVCGPTVIFVYFLNVLFFLSLKHQQQGPCKTLECS